MRHFHSGAIAGLVLGFAVATLAEDVTVTTYYPSPRGVYDELRTNGNTYLATQAAGNVGIGTAAPAAKLDVNGASRLGGNLTVTGDSTLNGTLNVIGNSTLATTTTGPLTVNGATNLTGTLTVIGATNLNSTLSVAGTSTLATTTTGALTVNGNETITGTVQIQGGAPAAGKFLKATNGNGDAVWDYATYAP